MFRKAVLCVAVLALSPVAQAQYGSARPPMHSGTGAPAVSVQNQGGGTVVVTYADGSQFTAVGMTAADIRFIEFMVRNRTKPTAQSDDLELIDID